MRKILIGLLSTFLFVFCGKPNTEKRIAIISGLSENIKQFEIVLYNRPPEINEEIYSIEIDDEMRFSLEIPAKNLRFGFILIKNQRYDFCLLPGDDIHIEISDSLIEYKGKGSGKNNFLYEAKKQGYSNDSYYDELNKARVLPVKFPKLVNSFKLRQLEYLSLYNKKNNLDSRFVEYYKTLNQLNYERQVIMYPSYFALRNKLNPDSLLELPNEYYELCNFSSVMNDTKLVSRVYINLINELISIKTLNLLSDNPTMDEWVAANHEIMFDSLSGKTQEYILVDWICNLLEDNYYDTLAVENFNLLKPDSFSDKVITKQIDVFNKKPELIGRKPPLEFQNTLLLNSKNEEISFGKLLSSMQGRFVYLDIWASWCAPCKKEMAYSKKLKNKLNSKDIEFVYISAEKADSGDWDKIFKISLTSKNHFVFKKGFNSELLSFMKIKGVPHYMIFDKQGKLIEYNAQRPSDINLEKKFIELLKNE